MLDLKELQVIKKIDGSDGVHEAAFIAGFENGGANLVFGAEWQNHHPLPIPEKPYVNMAGGWPLGPSSFGNPGTFQTTTSSKCCS